MKELYFLYVCDGRDVLEVTESIFRNAINLAYANVYPWEHMIPFESKDKDLNSQYTKYWITDENEKVVHKIGMKVSDLYNETASE